MKCCVVVVVTLFLIYSPFSAVEYMKFRTTFALFLFYLMNCFWNFFHFILKIAKNLGRCCERMECVFVCETEKRWLLVGCRRKGSRDTRWIIQTIALQWFQYTFSDFICAIETDCVIKHNIHKCGNFHLEIVQSRFEFVVFI